MLLFNVFNHQKAAGKIYSTEKLSCKKNSQGKASDENLFSKAASFTPVTDQNDQSSRIFSHGNIYRITSKMWHHVK